MTIALRATGQIETVELAAKRIPNGWIDALWHEVDIGPGGRPNQTSGLNILLSESADASKSTAAERLSSIRQHLISLDVVIDVAVFVQPISPAEVIIDPELLQLVAAMGIRFVISAYPTSDEDDE